ISVDVAGRIDPDDLAEIDRAFSPERVPAYQLDWLCQDVVLALLILVISAPRLMFFRLGCQILHELLGGYSGLEDIGDVVNAKADLACERLLYRVDKGMGDRIEIEDPERDDAAVGDLVEQQLLPLRDIGIGLCLLDAVMV